MARGDVVQKFSRWLTILAMSLRCLPSSFGSIGRMVWEEMSFKVFQDGCHDGHLGYLNGMILAILNLCHYDTSHQFLAQSNLRSGRRCRLKNFKMATMAAILDIRTEHFSNSESLCCSNASHQVLAQSTYGLGDVVWTISRWPPWRPSWISEQNEFSNSESL